VFAHWDSIDGIVAPTKTPLTDTSEGYATAGSWATTLMQSRIRRAPGSA